MYSFVLLSIGLYSKMVAKWAFTVYLNVGTLQQCGLSRQVCFHNRVSQERFYIHSNIT